MSDEQQVPPRRQTPTGRGRASASPDGAYEPPPLVRMGARGYLEVLFEGEDGRRRIFQFRRLQLPDLHPPLADAFAKVTGPTGAWRTLGSAEGMWGALKRFLAALAKLPQPPADLSLLTRRHLEFYRSTRLESRQERSMLAELRQVGQILLKVEPDDLLSEEVRSWLTQRRRAVQRPSKASASDSGYSDREFEAIMAAARRRVAAIRDRLRAGQRLLATFEGAPDQLDEGDLGLATVLTKIAATGEVPIIRRPAPHSSLRDRRAMLDIAKHLFLVDKDLRPLITLGVGLSGRNSETIKELAASHKLLEDKAVRADLIKRRRGTNRTFDHVLWEVGRPGQELRTPGGFYLLMEELTRLGRQFSGSWALWSIWVWRNGHIGAYDRSLSRGTGKSVRDWWDEGELVDDQGQPLRVNLTRLKKTVDVRNTRATGGHLPSSPRSNSMPVLFSNYLQGDASVRDWAGDVVTEALSDAEEAARTAHARVLASPPGMRPDPATAAEQLGLSVNKAEQLLEGKLDTAFAACEDIEHSPKSKGRRCGVSFLMCFSCENVLVTEAHIPQLKALLEWLADRLERLDEDTWWQRHGRTWLAITQHIRPKFSPAEWDRVEPAPGLAELMELLDGPQEQM